jgi:large subunit ribosomal protein L21
VYAVVETGGKQYKVTVGEMIEVERLPAAQGERVELDRVLLVSDDGQVRIGQPVLDDAKVAARVVGHGRSRKVLVFKYRAKERYRRKVGHRQDYTRLRIEAIEA